MIPEGVIRLKLRQAWSLRSSTRWTEDSPARGQCGETSLVVQDCFGGDILKTRLPDGRWHFYNRIDGRRFDFTDAQCEAPIVYCDQPASRPEAFADTNGAQYRYLLGEMQRVLASDKTSTHGRNG